MWGRRTNLQDRYQLSWCRVGGQVLAHAIPITDNDIRSCTGGNYLEHGQHLSS